MLEDQPTREHLKQRLIEAIRNSPVPSRTLTDFADYLEKGLNPDEGTAEEVELLRNVDEILCPPKKSNARQGDSLFNPPELRKLRPVIELFKCYKRAFGYSPPAGRSGGHEF